MRKYVVTIVSALVGSSVLATASAAQAGRTQLRPAPAAGVSSGTGLVPATTSAATPYKETSKKPGTGRSGSASLTVRALVDKSNKTELEITTGQLDTASAAPGSLEKLQVKALNAAGEVAFTKNVNKTDGTAKATLAFEELRRGQDIQVQANVTGIDPKRTDVVTVREQVKLRPDLRLDPLAVAKQAYVQAPVDVSATVVEANHDVGARGDCVLYVDGNAVDRAAGIWVDAGGMVSCLFSYTFTSLGTKKVEVAVEKVVPRDFDETNQRAAATIEIVEPSKPLQYWASFHDYDHDYASKSHGFYRRADGSYPATPDWQSVSTQKGWNQHGNVYAWVAEAWAFPLKQLKAASVFDGRQVDVMSADGITPDWSYTADAGTWHYSYACAYRYSADWGASVQVCSHHHKDDKSKTEYKQSSVHYTRNAGDVTYYSSGYNGTWGLWSGDGTRYSWNYSGRNARGAREAIGTGVGFAVEVTPAAGPVYKASPTIPLQPYDHSSTQTWTCSEHTWSYSEKYCWEHRNRNVGKHGTATR